MNITTEPFSQLPWLLPLVIIVGAWSLIWKGIALYRAGGRRDLVWYIVLFLVNTVGILEIFYIFYFSKKTPAKPAKK